jgi:ParB-like chromosome segregation protein Spo0J
MAGGDTYAATLADVARGMGIDPGAAIREAPVDAIRDDPATSPRVRLAPGRIRAFEQMMREEGVGALGPLVLAGPRPDGSYGTADGRHRLEAARRLGASAVPAHVFRWGSEGELFAAAVRLSARHGLPLSSREKRLVVCRLLREHPELSARALAEMAGTSHVMVANCRKALEKGGTPARAPARLKGTEYYAEKLLTAFDGLWEAAAAAGDTDEIREALAQAARRHYLEADPARELEVLATWVSGAQSLAEWNSSPG